MPMTERTWDNKQENAHWQENGLIQALRLYLQQPITQDKDHLF